MNFCSIDIEDPHLNTHSCKRMFSKILDSFLSKSSSELYDGCNYTLVLLLENSRIALLSIQVDSLEPKNVLMHTISVVDVSMIC